MRKIKLFFACLLMAVLSIGQMWAEKSTLTFTAACGGSGTADDGAAWTVTSDAAESTFDSSRGVHYGTNKKSVSYIQLNTDDIEGTITKIEVEAAGGNTPSLSVTIGGNIFGVTATGVTNSNVKYTFEPTAEQIAAATDFSGAIIIRLAKASKQNGALYVKSVAVTYSDGGGTQEKTLTSVSVSGTPDKTEYFAGQKFDPKGLTVTGHYSDDTNAEITTGITWSYNPAQELAKNQTSIKVKATVSDITSEDWFTVSDLTVAAGPDVFIDLVDAGWGFPTEYVVNETSYTNDDITIKLAGSTGNGFKVFPNSNIILGKEGAYLELPAFESPIERIVVAGNSTGSGKVTWNIFKGNAAVSTAVTGCKEDAYTFNIDPLEANVVYRVKVTNGNNLQIKNIQIFFGEVPAVTKPSISGETPFLNSTNVSISIPEGTTVYYTTDGSDPTKTAGTQYSAAFDLNNSATVKAIATDGVNWSEVAEKAFTKATIMTVAQARAAIEANPSGIANQYVAGTISKIDSYNSTYKSITYWISDDGTTTNQLQVYSGLAGVVKDHFESKDDLNVGDDVTVKGTLKLHNNSVYEFDYNNTIVIYKTTAQLAWSASSYNASLEGENTFPTLTNTNDVTVTYSSSDPEKAEINETTGAITLKAVGTVTITATFAGNETYKANAVSYEMSIASSLVTLTYNVDGGEAIDPVNVSALPNPLPTTTKAGKNFGGWFTDPEKEVAAVPGAAISENTTLYAKWLDPYTVAEAKTVIDANPDGIANLYVAGIISQIDSYSKTYHSITYWISADGTTTNQLQVYGGLIGNAATALEKEQFTAETDLELGDEVVVTGTLKLHNSTIYEFDKNNSIYTFSRKASAGLEYAETAIQKTVGDDLFTNPLTNPNSVTVTYSSSDEDVAVVDETTGEVLVGEEGTATITAAFAGNATYKAAEVSYTLTVSATVDNRKVANSPAEFTSVSGDMSPDDIAYASYKGGAGNDPFITSGKAIRLYQISGTNDFGGFITLTAKAGCTIDEVQITTTSSYSTTVAYSKDGNENLLKSESVSASGSYTTGTGLNVSSVNILNLGTGSSGRLEIASIKVYYTGEPAAIDHYELGGTYQTAFMQGDEFNHTGLIVYAAYDAIGENKVDITASCTFSDPDMSTTGDKTIEITYNEVVVTSYTINVAADSRKVANSPATFTAVSGDLTPADIMFESYKGGAGNDPYLATGGIRLYQISGTNDFGGFITLKAKKGCTIDQVKITTSAEYATTVAYSVDGNENLLGSTSVEKSGSYTTPAGLNKESVNILNLGTGSSGRLEIASIKVWYTGDALAVDHYILGGTYETVFEQFGTFSYEGLTVTAAYDAEETITETITGFTVEADLNTAGAAKANVMLNSVKIAEYDITVTASTKEDPALAYDPTSVILTKGDALSAPTFSNTYGVAVSYESDNEAVATVDAEGNIALAGGVGTAVITASFAGNEDYIESEATFTITVNAPAEDLNGTWVVATSIAAGDRIIIADVAAAGVVYTMGEQANNGTGNNRVAVESAVDEYGVLTPAAGTKTFLVVDVENGEFALQALNGNYLYAASGSSNHLKETSDITNVNAKWTITIENGIATIKALHEGHTSRNWMRKNESSAIFSCYGSGQNDIVIYKLGTPDYGSYQRNVTSGNYGTICLPQAGTIEGATLFEIGSYENNIIYVDEVIGSVMEAGKPYIFQATADQLNVTYTSGAQVAASDANGLHGFYNLSNMATDEADKLDLDKDQGNYILYNNKYWLVSGRAAYINNFRAYIKIGEIENTPAPEPTPGQAPRRRVAMTVHSEQTATGINELNAAEAPVKMIIDGQLYILRGEKMYNINGQIVK